MQFAPNDGVYVYFRYDEAKTILVALNTANRDMTVETARFRERMAGFTQAREIMSGAIIPGLSKITIPKNTALVLELLP